MSVTDIPAELMTPEQRAERIAELEREVAQEWKRFALTEALAIWAPFGLFLVVYVLNDSVADTGLYAAIGIAVVAMTALVSYWLARRILPRSRELQALRRSV